MFPQVIIDVRNTRCIVSRRLDSDGGTFTYDPCANWQQLEALAADAVRAAPSLSALYHCPPELAALALWAEDILALVTTSAEAEAAHDLGVDTVGKAARGGKVRSRQSGSARLLYKPDVDARW